HDCRPYGWWLSGFVEVGEFTVVVYLHLVRAVADLAPVGEQPCDQLLAPRWGRVCAAVGEDRVALPFEWYAAESCHEWFPALATVDAVLEAGARPVWGVDGGLVSAGHLRHRRVVLCGQRFQHRGFHDPAEPVETPDIAGEQVVLDDAPVLGPEGVDDRVVIMVVQAGL